MPPNNPSWAQNLTLGYAYDAISHGFSVFAKPNGTSLEVSVTQSNASGNGWNTGIFYGMFADSSKPPYTDRRDFYPNGAGNGGILANQLTLIVRKTGTNETVTATFTPANTPSGNPVTVSTSGGTNPTTPTTPPTTANTQSL